MCHKGYSLLPRCLLPQSFSSVERGKTESFILHLVTPQLSELGLQLHLKDAYLQTRDSDYSTIYKARSQLSSFPMARPLYLLSKKMLSANERSQYDEHLDTLSVQCKLRDSVQLETCCGSWNRLLLCCLRYTANCC